MGNTERENHAYAQRHVKSNEKRRKLGNGRRFFLHTPKQDGDGVTEEAVLVGIRDRYIKDSVVSFQNLDCKHQSMLNYSISAYRK